MKRIGLILNNIGSPKSFQPDDVGQYLKEFLMDKEIIELPYLFRYALVHFLIVPRRKFSSAEKYRRIWGKTQSPLIEISEKFCNSLQVQLGANYQVELGMVNGNPSLEHALIQMRDQGIDEIIFAPLYPQYARATSFASESKIRGLLRKILKNRVNLKVLPPFYSTSAFIDASVDRLKQDWSSNQWQHVLFSFHGLPESQVKKNSGCLQSPDCCARLQACQRNCYKAQCLQTASLIAKQANLTKDQYSVAFQSRLGRAKWIGPAATDVAKHLAQSGCQNLLVQTPSFVADCLETLEEIGLELKDNFIQAGGKNLKLVPCLNDDTNWINQFAGLVKKL